MVAILPGRQVALALVGVVVLLAACGTGTAPTGADGGPDALPPPAQELRCGGLPVPRAALDDPRPATSLGEAGLESLRGAEVPPVDDLARWTVVQEGPDGVVLLRELVEPLPDTDDPAGPVRRHEVLATQPSSDPAGNGWFLDTYGPCLLREPLPDGLGDALVALDPQRPPSDVADPVALLVTEQGCAGGQDAEGRVEVVRVVESATAVELVLGVRPQSGAATCPGNPPTPFEVDLDAPLGQRALRDASTLPVRTLAVGAPAALDCGERGEAVAASIDYTPDAPGLIGDPATAVRAWTGDGLGLDDRLDVRTPPEGASAAVAVVTVERDGRTLGRVSLEPATDGGLLVAGYEACSDDDPFP